jgi:hypothetical protein
MRLRDVGLNPSSAAALNERAVQDDVDRQRDELLAAMVRLIGREIEFTTSRSPALGRSRIDKPACVDAESAV